MNERKTNVINFHNNYSKSAKANFKPYQHSLSLNYKFLGVKVDSSVSWKDHIYYLETKLNRSYFVILNLSEIVGEEVLRMVYYAYFYSNLIYCIELWGNSIEINKIFKIQKRVIRLIAKVPPKTSCKALFKKYNILPVPCVYILRLILFVKKHMKYFSEQIKNNGKLRNKQFFNYPTHKTSLFSNSVHYMGIKLFNVLPLEIRTSETDKIFRHKLLEFLKSYNFYSVEDYLVHTGSSAVAAK